MLANFTEGVLTIPKAAVLGVAEEVSESLIDRLNTRIEHDPSSPTKPPRNKKNEALYNKLLSGKLDHLNSDERRHIETVLLKYAHVFHDEDRNDFKATQVMEHKILVGDAKPIRKPPYRTPYALRREMQDQIQKMLAKGVVPWKSIDFEWLQYGDLGGCHFGSNSIFLLPPPLPCMQPVLWKVLQTLCRWHPFDEQLNSV
jgi:hypothetical protein